MSFFQSKQTMPKSHHKSLNSQFTVLLNGLTCFFVHFRDKSLLALNMYFLVFCFARKKGFPVTRRYCCCNHCSFIYKNVSQFFQILIFHHNIWGSVYVCEIDFISYGILIKAVYFLSKTNSRKSKTWFGR